MTNPPRHKLAPLEAESQAERAQAVREMFSAIAPRYDLLNHLLSLNIDRRYLYTHNIDNSCWNFAAGTSRRVA